jgi:hypothetical protein
MIQWLPCVGFVSSCARTISPSCEPPGSWPSSLENYDRCTLATWVPCEFFFFLDRNYDSTCTWNLHRSWTATHLVAERSARDHEIPGEVVYSLRVTCGQFTSLRHKKLLEIMLAERDRISVLERDAKSKLLGCILFGPRQFFFLFSRKSLAIKI